MITYDPVVSYFFMYEGTPYGKPQRDSEIPFKGVGVHRDDCARGP